MIYTTASLALVSIGIWEAVLLFGVLMLLFGAKKLPELARGLGAGIRNFKGELSAPRESENTELKEEKK
jgi:sec-independent protein translocase protein TatA